MHLSKVKELFFKTNFFLKIKKKQITALLAVLLVFGIFQNCGSSNAPLSSSSGNSIAISSPSSTPSISTPSPSSSPFSSAFCSGSGTSADPFIICSESSLRALPQTGSSYFQLSQNISLSSSPFSIASFSAHLDGNGNTVDGLTTANTFIGTNSGTIKNTNFSNVNIGNSSIASAGYVALIGVNTGALNNIQFLSGTVTTAWGVYIAGILAKNLISGTANNLYFNGQLDASPISATYTNSIYVGGCVASNDGIVQNPVGDTSLVVRGSSTSATTVGGLVGLNSSTGQISGAAMRGGSVTGGEMVGGIVGTNGGSVVSANNAATISSLYSYSNVGGLIGENIGLLSGGQNSGAVTGTSTAGGIVAIHQVGSVSDSDNLASVSIIFPSGVGGTFAGGAFGIVMNSGLVSRVHSIGIVNVSGSGSGITIYQGKFIGEVGTGTTIVGAYYDSSVGGTASAGIGSGSSSGINPLTNSQFNVQSNFVGWDFVSIWQMGSSGYPVLR